MRIEVIRDIREIKKIEKFWKKNSFFFERTFSPGLCYEPGLKGTPPAAHDPGHVEAL
jgi:hypothetical protein